MRRSANVAAEEPEPEPAAPPASVEAAVLAMQPSNERWAERHAALLALPALVAAAPCLMLLARVLSLRWVSEAGCQRRMSVLDVRAGCQCR